MSINKSNKNKLKKYNIIRIKTIANSEKNKRTLCLPVLRVILVLYLLGLMAPDKLVEIFTEYV